jgi:hypothetical protein
VVRSRTPIRRRVGRTRIESARGRAGPDSNRIRPRLCRGNVTEEIGRRSGGAGQRRRGAGAAMGARRRRGEREKGGELRRC